MTSVDQLYQIGMTTQLDSRTSVDNRHYHSLEPLGFPVISCLMQEDATQGYPHRYSLHFRGIDTGDLERASAVCNSASSTCVMEQSFFNEMSAL